MSTTPSRQRPRLLHLHSTFDLGGKEARAVRLMNVFGEAFAHDIVSAVPSAIGAAAQIAPNVEARILSDFPPLAGRLTPARLKAIGGAIAGGGYDLVLTYNWGALDGVMANRLFASLPLVHHEDGFNDDETVRQKPGRVLYRRLALPAAQALVVPSELLERIALGVWKQPRRRVVRIPNGIDSARFAAPPPAGSIPGFERREGEVVVGTLAGLRKVKNLPRLVRAFAAATRIVSVPARLVIVGDGPERGAILAEAEKAGVADRLVMPGFIGRPELCVGHFDIFALSSDSEQFPLSLVEAMAAGLPAISTDVGDVRAIVSERNRPMLARIDDDMVFARLLARMIGDPLLRAELGAANRARVVAEYDEAVMAARYRDLYTGAMGRAAGTRAA